MLKQGDLVTYTPYLTDVELSGATVGRVISIDDNDFADIALASLDGSSIVRQKVPLAATGYNVYKATPVELERFDLEITSWVDTIHDITPTPAAGYMYVPHRVQIKQVGGDVAWSDLSAGDNDLTLCYNINGTVASAVSLVFTDATAPIFAHALAENAVKLDSKSTIITAETATTYAAKPIGIYTEPYGTPVSTTKTNGGTGHAVNDVITMGNGTLVTVLTVAAGVVLTYSVTGTAIPLGADTQDSTTGTGIGFAMTVNTVRSYTGGTGTFKVSVWATLETV